MRDDYICMHQKYKTDKREEQKIYHMVIDARFERSKREPEIIEKEDLGSHKWILIEHNQKNPPGCGAEHPILLAMFDIKINEEKEELSGIRLFQTIGRRYLEKYTYNLKKYGKSWRAWTNGPAEVVQWDE